MSQHPEIEQKLLDEVLTVMGAASSPTYEQLAEMRYLNAVLKVRGSHPVTDYAAMVQRQQHS
jgi:hypothetical protein